MKSTFRIAALTICTIVPTLGFSQTAPQDAPQYSYPAAPQGPAARSHDGQGKTYVALRLGAIVPRHQDMEDYSAGFAVEGAVGYRFHPNVAMELSIGRFSMAAEYQAIISGVLADVKEDVVAYPVLGTVRLTLPLDKLELFALVGGGVYIMSAEAEATAPGYYPLTDSDSDSPFGLHVGWGANLHVSPRASLGAEVRSIIGTTKMWDSTSHFDSVTVTGGLTYRL